ncbi:hypothetical protein Anas_00991, partial [Armadillidium nasatum]
MKRLLQKKERSLSKYNRVKRVKDHVRKTVLKKNFENSFNGVYGFTLMFHNYSFKVYSLAVSKIKKDGSIINVSNRHLKSVSLKNPLTADDSPCLSNDFDKMRSKEKLMAHDCSEVKETSFCNNSDSINVPYSILKRSLSLESFLNDSTNFGTLTSDSTTPIIKTKRLSKEHLNKKHVKRLFSNSNNNNDYNFSKVTTEQFKRNPCKIVDSKHSHTVCCVNSEESLVSLSNSQDIKPNVEICQKLENENNLEEIKRFKDTSRKEDIYISKCKPVSEDNCILNDSPNKVIASCIASIPDKSPHIIVLYSSGFSIWALYNEETEDGSKFYWQKNVNKDVAFKNMKSSFFIFGSGSLHCVYFMLIKAPSGINRPFEVDFVCLSSLEQVVIVEDYLPLRGCAECSFSCCDLQNWKFLYSFHSCKNEFCPNFKRSQALYIFSFDLIYSEKMQKWDLTLRIEKEHIFEHILLSTVLLHKCGKNLYTNCLILINLHVVVLLY